MATATSTWTKKTAVIGIAMLALNARTSGQIDLSGKRGALITVFAMRSGATAVATGVQARIRRLHGSATPYLHSATVASFNGGVVTAVSGVAEDSGSPNPAGATSLTIDAAKTYAAGSNGDIMLGIIDDTTTPTLASEIVRQVSATSTTVKLLEYPLESAHNNVAHVVADQAELWTAWVEGGSRVEVAISYISATGDSLCVGAYADTYDSDNIV